MVTPRELKARERKVERLAEAEHTVMERLVRMRGDLDLLTHTLDKLTFGPPRMRAGSRSDLSNLVPFRRGRFLA
jgi:hypothetical protein